MAPKRTKAKPSRRFTVTLGADEYDALKAIADGAEPPLSLRYVVEFALRDYLARSDVSDVRSRLGGPGFRKKS